jgi:hypothetical protein
MGRKVIITPPVYFIWIITKEIYRVVRQRLYRAGGYRRAEVAAVVDRGVRPLLGEEDVLRGLVHRDSDTPVAGPARDVLALHREDLAPAVNSVPRNPVIFV